MIFQKRARAKKTVEAKSTALLTVDETKEEGNSGNEGKESECLCERLQEVIKLDMEKKQLQDQIKKLEHSAEDRKKQVDYRKRNDPTIAVINKKKEELKNEIKTITATVDDKEYIIERCGGPVSRKTKREQQKKKKEITIAKFKSKAATTTTNTRRKRRQTDLRTTR